MANKHKPIKRIELMGGLLPKEMGMSQHLDKEQVREKIILISSCGECPHCGTDKDVNIACKMLDLDNYGRKIPGNNTPNWCPLPDAGYRLPTLDVEKLMEVK